MGMYFNVLLFMASEFVYLFLILSLTDCAGLEDNCILLKSCGCWWPGEPKKKGREFD